MLTHAGEGIFEICGLPKEGLIRWGQTDIKGLGTALGIWSNVLN